MPSKLIYQERHIATVVIKSGEFLKFFGKYDLGEDMEGDPIISRVKEFIAFWIRTESMVESEKLDNDWYEEESSFQDLIESDDWWLEDDSGKRTPISVPIFTSRGMSWVLDSERT